MVNDDDWHHSAGCPNSVASRWCAKETAWYVAELQAKLLAGGNTGPEAHLFARAASRGRSDQPRHHDCRYGGVPLYVVHTSCEEAHGRSVAQQMQGKRVWGEPLIQRLTTKIDRSDSPRLGPLCTRGRMRGPINNTKTPSDQVTEQVFSVVATDFRVWLNSTPGWVFFRGYKQH
jgi:dihydroorotase-like cyclic amidohydrolase